MLLTPVLKAQGQEIVLIIDTFINQRYSSSLLDLRLVEGVSVNEPLAWRVLHSKTIHNLRVENKADYDFISKFELASDSSFLEIALDTVGSQLQIVGLDDFLGDTLHIDKIVRSERLRNDTIIDLFWYKKLYSDSIASKAHKFKKKMKVIKNGRGNKGTEFAYLVRINGISYIGETIEESCNGDLITGNGYKPSRRYKRFYSKNKKYEGRVLKFYWQHMEIKYCNRVRIKLDI